MSLAVCNRASDTSRGAKVAESTPGVIRPALPGKTYVDSQVVFHRVRSSLLNFVSLRMVGRLHLTGPTDLARSKLAIRVRTCCNNPRIEFATLTGAALD